MAEGVVWRRTSISIAALLAALAFVFGFIFSEDIQGGASTKTPMEMETLAACCARMSRTSTDT